MFGFGSRKLVPGPDRTRVVGLELTSSRARAVALAAGRTRALILDEPAEELALFLALDRRTPEAGQVAYRMCRKLPHAICSNFLPQLGHPRQWPGPRATVTPESALQAAFEKLREPIVAETDAVGLSLPTYLSAAQVKSVLELAGKAKLPVRGTVTLPLAVVAHRARWVLGEANDPAEEADEGRPDWVVPMRRPSPGATAVVVVDTDEFALTATVVAVEPTEVKTLVSATWPQASLKAWKDRLLDALSDRCVRLCRRDPRDSAEAEQALYEQLDTALDRTAAGHPVTLTVRSAHWYQDLTHRPDDFDAYCAGLARIGAEGVRELLRAANLPVPPRAVWLTASAARLPGLAAAIHHTSPEQTDVLALPANAVADATAVLVPYWLTGMIPRVHLDAAIPLTENPSAREEGARNQGPGIERSIAPFTRPPAGRG